MAHRWRAMAWRWNELQCGDSDSDGSDGTTIAIAQRWRTGGERWRSDGTGIAMAQRLNSDSEGSVSDRSDSDGAPTERWRNDGTNVAMAAIMPALRWRCDGAAMASAAMRDIALRRDGDELSASMAMVHGEYAGGAVNVVPLGTVVSCAKTPKGLLKLHTNGMYDECRLPIRGVKGVLVTIKSFAGYGSKMVLCSHFKGLYDDGSKRLPSPEQYLDLALMVPRECPTLLPEHVFRLLPPRDGSSGLTQETPGTGVGRGSPIQDAGGRVKGRSVHTQVGPDAPTNTSDLHSLGTGTQRVGTPKLIKVRYGTDTYSLRDETRRDSSISGLDVGGNEAEGMDAVRESSGGEQTPSEKKIERQRMVREEVAEGTLCIKRMREKPEAVMGGIEVATENVPRERGRRRKRVGRQVCEIPAWERYYNHRSLSRETVDDIKGTMLSQFCEKKIWTKNPLVLAPIYKSVSRRPEKADKFHKDVFKPEDMDKYYYYPVNRQHTVTAVEDLEGEPIFNLWKMHSWPARVVWFSDRDFTGYRQWMPLVTAGDDVFRKVVEFYAKWAEGKLLGGDGKTPFSRPGKYMPDKSPGLQAIPEMSSKGAAGETKMGWLVRVPPPPTKKKMQADDKFFVVMKEPDMFCWQCLADMTDAEKLSILDDIFSLRRVFLKGMARLSVHHVRTGKWVHNAQKQATVRKGNMLVEECDRLYVIFNGEKLEDNTFAVYPTSSPTKVFRAHGPSPAKHTVADPSGQAVACFDVAEEERFSRSMWEDGSVTSSQGPAYGEMERNPSRLLGLLVNFCKAGQTVFFFGKAHAVVVWELLRTGRNVVALEKEAKMIDYLHEFVKARVADTRNACEFARTTGERNWDPKRDMYWKLSGNKRTDVWDFLFGPGLPGPTDLEYSRRRNLVFVVLNGYHGTPRESVSHFLRSLEHVYFTLAEPLTLENYKSQFDDEDPFDADDMEELSDSETFDFESMPLPRVVGQVGDEEEGSPRRYSTSPAGLKRVFRGEPVDDQSSDDGEEERDYDHEPCDRLPVDHDTWQNDRLYFFGKHHRFTSEDVWGHNVVWHPRIFQPAVRNGIWVMAIKEGDGKWSGLKRLGAGAFKRKARTALVEHLSLMNPKRNNQNSRDVLEGPAPGVLETGGSENERHTPGEDESSSGMRVVHREEETQRWQSHKVMETGGSECERHASEGASVDTVSESAGAPGETHAVQRGEERRHGPARGHLKWLHARALVIGTSEEVLHSRSAVATTREGVVKGGKWTSVQAAVLSSDEDEEEPAVEAPVHGDEKGGEPVVEGRAVNVDIRTDPQRKNGNSSPTHCAEEQGGRASVLSTARGMVLHEATELDDDSAATELVSDSGVAEMQNVESSMGGSEVAVSMKMDPQRKNHDSPSTRFGAELS
ncbi:hypothetical protein CBR_g6446 [Chara braunii]|uniref:Uncharacterized protein n=1 Tax=Chara braunii TaxID=69332 RepID=A0A388KJV9_CHABU|nr:hypothetical protein CBR_g6446 [Chara braunii]|eukprot:GBG70319.1 hypothetical protein CBR_g6446 [Chara braunii]